MDKFNLMQIRRELHKIPEIGFKEHKTQKFIIEELNKLGLKYEKIIKTGVLSFIDLGFDETICFRADIDGLKITEENDIDYKSKHEGYMHACGHDGHATILIGLAEYISNNNLSHIKYNILLLFQPAEEGPGGANLIVKENTLNKYNVKCIFGIHIMPFYNEGLILSKSKSLMANANEFDIKFIGKSSHIGKPKEGIDALEIASKFILDLKDILSINIHEEYIFGIGKFVSGTVRNVISQETVIEGSYRTFSNKVNIQVDKYMYSLKCYYERKYNIKIIIDVRKLYPEVYNNENIYNIFKEIITSKFDYKELKEPLKLAEDFSFYQKEIPGVFYFLGSRNEKLGFVNSLHNSKFNFSEKILKIGVQSYVEILNNFGDKYEK